jgi:hypothetical protein
MWGTQHPQGTKFWGYQWSTLVARNGQVWARGMGQLVHDELEHGVQQRGELELQSDEQKLQGGQLGLDGILVLGHIQAQQGHKLELVNIHTPGYLLWAQHQHHHGHEQAQQWREQKI